MGRRLTSNNPAFDLSFQMHALGLEPIYEHRFHPTRRWRFDMAFPNERVAVELDGGSWIGGRHTSGAGFEADCVKLSEAAAMGWRVLRVTPAMVNDGRAIQVIMRALEWAPT